MSNIQIEKEDVTLAKRLHKYSDHNTIWSVLWRFLLVCAVIDGGIYFYCNNIEHISVTDGIRLLREKIHGTSTEGEPATHHTRDKAAGYFRVAQEGNTIATSRPGENHKNPGSALTGTHNLPEGKMKLYSWEDEQGRKHFSNTGYPPSGYYRAIPP